MISSYQDDIHLFWKRVYALQSQIAKNTDLNYIWEDKLRELMKLMGQYEVRRT